MSNSWDEMKNAKEGSYFEKKNNEALQRLKKVQEDSKPRLSPISGEPLVQEVVCGVVVDRCQSSGGLWLDAGELGEILEASKGEESENFISQFFSSLKK